MIHRIVLATAMVLCAALSACGGTMPTQSGSTGSGITVFGEIDTSVSRTR